MDHDALSSGQCAAIEQGLPCGKRCHWQGGGLVEFQSRRYAGHQMVVGQHVFSIAALATLAVVGGCENAIADFKIGNAFTHGRDNARGVKADYIRENIGSECCQQSLAILPVGGIDPRVGYPDQYFPGAGNGCG